MTTHEIPDEVMDHRFGEPCGLCFDEGLVYKEDSRRRVIGYACTCSKGDPWRRRTKDSHGRECALTATYKNRRFTEFDEWNAE